MNTYGRIVGGGSSIHGKVISGGGSGGRVQHEKTVTPTDNEQIIKADEGYNSLAKVVVEAIPSNYGHIAYNGATIRVY